MACGDGCEADSVEEGVGQRDRECRALADPPRAMGAASGLGRQGLADPAAAQRREASAPTLPVRPGDGAKPTPGPLVEAEQDIGDLAESEVAPPPDEVTGQLLHERSRSLGCVGLPPQTMPTRNRRAGGSTGLGRLRGARYGQSAGIESRSVPSAAGTSSSAQVPSLGGGGHRSARPLRHRRTDGARRQGAARSRARPGRRARRPAARIARTGSRRPAPACRTAGSTARRRPGPPSLGPPIPSHATPGDGGATGSRARRRRSAPPASSRARARAPRRDGPV